MPLAFWTPSPFEMFVILLVAILLFGRRLPELGRSLGRSLTEFRRGLHDFQDEVTSAGDETPSPTKEAETAEANTDTAPPRTCAPASSESGTVEGKGGSDGDASPPA